MDDPLQYVESLDESTVEYVREQNEALRKYLGELPGTMQDEISGYYGSRRSLSLKVTDSGILQSYIEGGIYHVRLGENEIYSTRNVVFWIDADRDGSRIAVFETGGSDSGHLTIFSDGKPVEEMDGNIDGVSFMDGYHYVVKTFSDSASPDGGEANSHRVLRDGRVVFGSGMSSEQFITLHRSGDTMFAVVGNWSRSEVYRGNADDPSSWMRIMDEQHSITPLGIHDGKDYFLEDISTGVVTVDGKNLISGELAINAAHLTDSGILVLHMKDARVLPVLYGYDGVELARFETGLPMGVKASDSDGRKAAISLESFGIPYSIHLLEGNKLNKIDEQVLLDLKVEDRWADSGGTRIHYFLVNGNGEDKRGALAYGYGGFNISIVPFFSPLFAYLSNHGVTVAVSNLRGGSEYGEEWHKAGMREKKQNVFNDFRAVIESLKEEGLGVVVYGVSNGGLLAGTTLTQIPDTIQGAVIGNPVLDMMRFHRMSVGKYWVPEYGNPDEPGDAEYLLKYSPYHNIGGARYPPSMAYTRMKDDRVHPAHAIKFHMALKEKSPDAYLRVNTEGGHIGITADEMVAEISDMGAFVLKCLGRN